MIASTQDVAWMTAALEEAGAAASAGDVPVGAVLVLGDAVVARAGNRNVRDRDATAHAEMIVMRAGADVLGNIRLRGATLYVTLEPCAMCAGAIVLARLERVVFGAWDDRAGMAGSVEDLLRHPRLNHRPQVLGGVRCDESSQLLRRFFEERRGFVDTSLANG